MERQRKDRSQSATMTILIIAFAIITLGTVCLPALLAVICCWQWALCYPLLFVAVVILSVAHVNRRK